MPVPLPLGVGELHDERVRPHALHRLAARVLVLRAQLSRAATLVVASCATRSAFRVGRVRAAAVRAAAAPLLGQLADGVDAPEVLAAIGLDDHRRVKRRRLLALPEEELLPIALEGDFDEVSHPI